MSKSNTRNTIRLLIVFVVSVALVGADLVVLAHVQPQNANSSTTMQNDNMSGANTNMGTTTGGGRRRRRRGRRASNASMTGDMSGNMNANVSPDMQGNANDANMAGGAQNNANMTGDMSGNTGMMGGRRRRRRGRRSMAANANATGDMTGGNANVTGDMSGNANTSMSGGMTGTTRTRRGGCDRNVTEQTDLSGTYNGTVNYPDGGWSGDATLTITGNQFTLTSGSQTINGRVTAATTCNYTAAAMTLGERPAPTPGQPAPEPPTTVSVHVRRTGNGIWLTPAPGAAHPFTFSSGGGMGRRGRRGRRSGMGMTGDMSGGNTNTSADTSGNTNTTGDMSGNTNMSGDNTNTGMTGGGRRRRRRGRRGTMNTNANMSDNSNMGGNTNMGGNSNQ